VAEEGGRVITRRKCLVGFGLGALAAAFPSFAQQGKVHRIGFLAVRSRSTPSNPDVIFDEFVQAMRELGYIEGKNLIIEWRFADGKYERLPGLAAELVQLKPDLIVSHTTPGTRELQRATSTIPIVMTAIIDPVGSGFAASLARPGGNITGLSIVTIDVSPKQIELLRSILPRLSRVAVLLNPGTSSHPAVLKSTQAAAQQIGITVLPVKASTAEEIECGFAMMRRERAEAVIIATDGFFFGQRRQIAELAVTNRMPTMNPFRDYVAAGGMLSYGPNIVEYYRRAASYVDKILKGAKPGDLPIEQPTKIHLAINRKTAEVLGLRVPQELLLRTDEVFE
jgi:putative ABC transport system substrate-binding protein